MHTNFLNIQSPKEKMQMYGGKKTVSNTETTIGLHQQVQLLVIKLLYWAKLAVINPHLL